MAQSRFTWATEPGPEFERVARALRELDSTLPTALRKELRAAASGATKDVRRSILQMPTRPGLGGARKSRGTRRRVARGVSVQAKVGGGRFSRGASFRIVTKMPDGEEILPRGFSSMFHHPLFDTNIEMLQEHYYDWFIGPIGDHKTDLQTEIHRILRKYSEMVDRAGS